MEAIRTTQNLVAYSHKLVYISVALLFLTSLFLSAQTANETIFNNYQENAKIPKEKAFVHLSKSTYVVGEQLGYTAYIIDHTTNAATTLSGNLYIKITNEQGKVIIEKMLQIKDGIASNVIELDDSFQPGFYTIIAFTNWMRNFKEQNYYTEHFQIIAPTAQSIVKTDKNDIEVQFMPEGGHFLNNVNAAVGVLMKDYNGVGLPNLNGKIYDQNNKFITEFKLNKMGLGRFYLTPQSDYSYTAKFMLNDKLISRPINHTIKDIGIALSCNPSNDKAVITLKTNKQSLEQISKNRFTLAIHNDHGISQENLTFNSDNTISRILNTKELPAGINIITVFNERLEPIIERLFFNYNGLKLAAIDSHSISTAVDSITISLSIPQVDASLVNNLSISVLPQNTKSYRKAYNINSTLYLKNHVKGHIENSNYYFKNNDRKTAYDLDNLLLTQGWSSYDWDYKFDTENVKYVVERGITLKATIRNRNKKNINGYMVNFSSYSSPLIVKTKQDSLFHIQDAFIEDDASFTITEFRSDNELKRPRLNIQAFPNTIPVFNNSPAFSLSPEATFKHTTNFTDDDFIVSSVRDLQELEEILIIADKDAPSREREMKLNFERFGGDRVKVITDADRKSFPNLEDFLMVKGGVRVDQGRGSTSFLGRYGAPMAIFIDDTYMGTSIPPRYVHMFNIDYIDIDKVGLGTLIGAGGFRTSQGQIRIYTGGEALKNYNPPQGNSYNVPLTFSSSKKFYAPVYKDPNSQLYQHYGTIDWKPNVKVDENRTFTFKILPQLNTYTIYIEGLINGDITISDELTIIPNGD